MYSQIHSASTTATARPTYQLRESGPGLGIRYARVAPE